MNSHSVLTLTCRCTLLLVCLLLPACQHDDDSKRVEGPVTVTFTTGVEQQTEQTRAGITGPIATTDRLKETSVNFGVFAYYTKAQRWDAARSEALPDFMYNEFVEWGILTSDGSLEGWRYEPLKYWPNSNNPADDQNNDTGNDPAQGDQDHSYISFFAYAPFVGDKNNGTFADINSDDENGIVALSPYDATGAPKVKYQLQFTPNQQVDLLWAAAPNKFKYGVDAGELDDETLWHYEGTTSGMVPLQFHHALACIELRVQRVYNDFTVARPMPYNDRETKLFVDSVTLTPTTLNWKGTLNLENGEWDTENGTRDDVVFSFSANDFVASLRGTTSENDEEDVVADVELSKWATEGTGVDEQQRVLLTDSRTMLFLPQENVRFTPRATYSMVVRDDDLQLPGYLTGNDGHRYLRIVNRDITGNQTTGFTFVGGKKYTMLLRIGVESVELLVTDVVDWDFPIRFHTDVTPYTDETGNWQNKTLNEADVE